MSHTPKPETIEDNFMTVHLAKSKITEKIELFQFIIPDSRLYDSVTVVIPDEYLLAIRKVFDQYDVMQAQLRELFTQE